MMIRPELRKRLWEVYELGMTVDPIVKDILARYKELRDEPIQVTLLADADQTFAAVEWRIGRTRVRIRLVSLTSDLTTFWVYHINTADWGEFIRDLAERTRLPVSTLRTRVPERKYMVIDPKIFDANL
ncbi:MAG: hypothetical protein UZ21_OP11001000485 [Microgenomates bacterium OLB22]|nr:MAG: hypothetical protein UZ21_OP11001000485 [Microgenomates bacterium OLB22]